MKKFILPFAAVLAAVFVLGSCSMEKRHYRPGYHVDWNNHKQTAPAQNDQTSVAPQEMTPATQSFVAPAPAETENAPAAAQPAAVENHVSPKAASHHTVITEKAVTESRPVQKLIASEHNAKRYTANKPASGGSDDTVLLVILAILIPPLAVYLYEGSWTKRCTINLILTLLCGIPGMIHALIVVLE